MDADLFLPPKTLFTVAEHCPTTAALRPGGGSVAAVGDVIPACISSGPAGQAVSAVIPERTPPQKRGAIFPCLSVLV